MSTKRFPEDGFRCDSLPEYAGYTDNGCKLFKKCLECPLPKCRYDDPGGAAGIVRVGRTANLRAMAAAGADYDDLARVFGLSWRSVYRIVDARE